MKTRHIINASTLAHNKKGAILDYTARGGLAHRSALAEALRSGRLGGAGLDVIEGTPPVLWDDPLLYNGQRHHHPARCLLHRGVSPRFADQGCSGGSKSAEGGAATVLLVNPEVMTTKEVP